VCPNQAPDHWRFTMRRRGDNTGGKMEGRKPHRPSSDPSAQPGLTSSGQWPMAVASDGSTAQPAKQLRSARGRGTWRCRYAGNEPPRILTFWGASSDLYRTVPTGLLGDGASSGRKSMGRTAPAAPAGPDRASSFRRPPWSCECVCRSGPKLGVGENKKCFALPHLASDPPPAIVLAGR
jgi:hypothetical protein